MKEQISEQVQEGQAHDHIQFEWSRFHELSVTELHEVMALRQRVFILEQRCFYLDADAADLDAQFHPASRRAAVGRLWPSARRAAAEAPPAAQQPSSDDDAVSSAGAAVWQLLVVGSAEDRATAETDLDGHELHPVVHQPN